jgi:hypothetical protein
MKSIKHVILFSTLILLTICVKSQDFDSQKWTDIGDYRYQIVKTKYFSELMHKQNKNELIALLGEPFTKEKVKKGPLLLNGKWTTVKNLHKYTYCLGGKDKLRDSCDGSYMVVYVYKSKVEDIMFVWVER